MKVAIVSPEVMGVHRNGGVGTHVYWLARVLARNGCDVDIIYVGGETSTKEHISLFNNYNINLVFLNKFSKNLTSSVHLQSNYYELSAYQVYLYTIQKKYDVIHFQDLSGNGYYACMAKKLGLAYQNTKLVSTIHSNNRWVRDGTHIHRLQYDGIDLEVDSFEDTQVQLSDAIVSPSHYMKNWYMQQGILITDANCQVIPYCYIPLEKQKINVRKVDTTHLAFFSRLETRKGIDIFCEGIDLYLAQNPNHNLKQITFMGRFGRLDAHQLSENYVESFAKKWQHSFRTKVNILTEFESLQAKEYLLKTGAVVVVPTRLDNLPFVTIEAAENKFPILATNTGGISEVLSGDNLFEANKHAFAKKLEQVLSLSQDKAEELLLNYTPHYNSSRANQAWIDYHQGLVVDIATEGKRVEVVCVLGTDDKKLNYFIKMQPLPKDITILAVTQTNDVLVYWAYSSDMGAQLIDYKEFKEHLKQKTTLFITDRINLRQQTFELLVPQKSVVGALYLDSKLQVILPHATKELLLSKPVMDHDFVCVSGDLLLDPNITLKHMLFFMAEPTVWNLIFTYMLQAQQTLISPEILYQQTSAIYYYRQDFLFDKYRLDTLRAQTTPLLANLLQVDYYPNLLYTQDGVVKTDERLYRMLFRVVFKYKRRLAAHPRLYKIAYKCYHMALRFIRIISKIFK